MALGDSLTAGLGLDPTQAYPALLQKRLDAAGLSYEVVNAGVSGDTSAGGLRRIDWALDGDVKVLIVALGGNDALRGLPVEQLEQNLTTIVERADARKIKVILAGMEAPPNYGAAYTAAFRQTYRDVAAAARRGPHSVSPRRRRGAARDESGRRHPPDRGRRRKTGRDRLERLAADRETE